MTNSLGARILLACSLTLSLICPAWVRGDDVALAWNPSSDPSTAGYNLYYGLNSGAYTSSVDAGANLTGTVSGLTPGLMYYLAVTSYDTNGDESGFSNEVTNRLPILPSIFPQPLTQTAIAGAPVTLAVSADGDPPLTFQWWNGLAPIPGATASLLSWPQISDANAGNYTVIVSNPWGSTSSSVATLTVIDPPLTPHPAAISNGDCHDGGVVLVHWHRHGAVVHPMVLTGATALAGATNSTLAWASVAATNAGNYYLTVSNAAGAVTSSVVTLTVMVPL